MIKHFLSTSAAVAALAVISLGANVSSASAQFYGPPPMYAAPYAPPMLPYARPMLPPPGGYYGPRPMLPPPVVMPAGPYRNDGMGVDLSPLGPYAGAAAGRVLMSNPYTAPLAPWAAERVDANAASAGREYNPGDAAVRTFTGVSPRDIQTYGIAGGPNSEVRKIGRLFGF
ncbi:hypothetical protein ABIF64_001735 [Bradyrhizobium japonicum]|uniref:hypothetical protein n=1 Tax=Bradyrhizobium japonicum TaxID=375 RepID=UPI001BADCAF3|nr:hypothetical protein [Bradyrhizobium japonicum]MBR0731683.1 hypothetical protein [Bradyrhizobium japonicum]